MDKELRGSILKKWKTACKSNATGIKLPKGFLFSEENGVLTMTFQTKRGFGLDRSPCNMQENGAAFEGWALAVYVHYLDRKGRVCLDIPENLPEPDESLYTKYPHFSRFLYRAIRFSEQYPWFQLSGRLEALTKAFERFLNRYHFTNNLPTRPAGVKGKLESVMESRFAGEDSPLRKVLGGGRIYRQLPVGLFKETVAEKNHVFTGRTSAVDLWTISGSTLTVVELKAKNKMTGAVTELFFYANYAYDLFVSQSHTFVKNENLNMPKRAVPEDRGYGALLSASLNQVRGYLLLDPESCHPLINGGVLDELNQGRKSPQITYGCLKYELEGTVETGR